MKLLLNAALGAAALLGTSIAAPPARADDAVARGAYLVRVMGCNDCHTPGVFLGKPDFAKALAGSDVGFEVPGLGIHWGPNLTPDQDTGLGKWSEAEIITAFTRGIAPDGTRLIPTMPYNDFAGLTDADQHAVAAYLRSLPPIRNAVPAPTKPGEKAAAPYMTVIMPNMTVMLAK
jgi:mono/diheme cytochrome c family protein